MAIVAMRAIDVTVAGAAEGSAVVADEPLSLWGGLDPATGEIIDRRHPLSGQIVSGRVVVIPHGRGSCSASGVLLEAIRFGAAPAGFIMTRADPIIALGAILGDELYAHTVPVFVITRDDWRNIRSGDQVRMHADGAIDVIRSPG